MPSNTLYTPNNSLLRQNGRVLTIDNPMSSRDDFLIRALQQNNHKEVEAVVALINRSYRSKENWTSEYGIVFGLRTTISQLKADLERFYMYLAINRATGTVVGCVKVGLTKETTAGPLAQIAGHMGLLTVSSDYQSQGLGSRLADFAEKTCKERGMMTMVRIPTWFTASSRSLLYIEPQLTHSTFFSTGLRCIGCSNRHY